MFINVFLLIGYYVRTCEEDFGRDRCEQCPEKTFLLDKTNSTNAHTCPNFEWPGKMKSAHRGRYRSRILCWVGYINRI